MRVDEIRQELVVDAPIERVWEALTSADEIAQWFGDSAEVDLRPGGRARFGWSEFDAVTDCIIEVVDRPHRFSYRWEALKDTPVEEASTLVEFTLEPADGGTRVTLLESGFATLPEHEYQHRFEENSSGWKSELGDLERHLVGVAS
jgi:uncharacterized protein YndB with AHSA1/START domain